MQIEITNKSVVSVSRLKVNAAVRYWEDASVNGVEDTDGTLIPHRNGDNWEPVIDLATGKVIDWPAGTVADVHYKVCDAGLYWLLNDEGVEVAKWNDHYVPSEFLCHGDNGYGDYIIFKVDGEGQIQNWRTPSVDPDEWTSVTASPTQSMKDE